MDAGMRAMVWAYMGNSAVARSPREPKASVMARSFVHSTALLWSCSFALHAAGCSDETLVHGGQSGTEGGGTYECPPLTEGRMLALDEEPAYFELTPRQLAETLGARRLAGRWLATELTELSIQLDAAGGVRALGSGVCSGADASVRVRTSDGTLDTTVLARIHRGTPPSEYTLDAELPGLPESVLAAAYPADVSGVRTLLGEPRITKGAALHVSLNLGHALQYAIVYDEAAPRGVWQPDPLRVPLGAPQELTPDSLFSQACAGAEELEDSFGEHTPFPSADAAQAGVAKVWVRCRDGLPASHEGILISPDGSWRHLDLEAGELVARSGFGDEGRVLLTDTSSMNGPGIFQLTLGSAGRSRETVLPFISGGVTLASERALVFRTYSAWEEWPATVYQPVQLGVRSVTPEFADGERAGSAACERSEHGLVSEPAAAARLLSGEFVLCRGSLPGGVARLRFEPSQVELHAEDGSVLATHSFDPASGQLQVGTNRWLLSLSRQPLKLSVEEMIEPRSHAVFSALP